jgi:hypothetical protein
LQDGISPAHPSVAFTLWFLTALFFLRVSGQALVAFLGVQFLPPMEQWYSGLIPYSALLPIQIAMLAVMAMICAGVARGHGLFATPRRNWGRALRFLSIIYFLSMALRYALTMAWRPEQRWFDGVIPIFFHFVLAGFLFTWGRYHSRQATFARPDAAC